MAQQKIRIRLKGYDHHQVDKSARDIVETAPRTGATITGPVTLPTEPNVYCVIRSPFKDKDSREHFEVRELLSRYEFPGDDIPVIQVSALKALEGDEEWVPKILELMEAVDSYIPEPTRDVDKSFLMPIEDVFTITGRGTVVTGRIEQGQIKSGDEVEIVGIHDKTEKTVVTGLEMFNKVLDFAQAGDNAGALLRGVKREEVERGQVLAKPASITPHTHFNAEVYVLSKDEGGRHTPFFNGYRPQFYFRTTDVTGSISIWVLSPGMTISWPSGNLMEPVTSVVRK